MVPRLILLASALSAASVVFSPEAIACSNAARIAGLCSLGAETDGTGVDLHGEVTVPGSGGGPGGGGPVGSDAPVTDGAEPALPPDKPWVYRRPTVLMPEETPGEHVVGASEPAVTIRDLVSFIPAASAPAGQPSGWGLVGLHTNFHTETAVQELEGELLGLPASVRFTPRAWHWSYGDGSSATTTIPGRPWTGAEEFEPTPTSHRYSSTGTYTVSVAVEFGVDYRFHGLPWRSLQDPVIAPSDPLTVRVGTADTVLVTRDCGAGSGPGC